MILQDINTDLTNSLKAKDTQKVLVLRYLISEINNKKIELKAQDQELTDQDTYNVIKKSVKQQKKALDMYVQGKRQDLVDSATYELQIKEEYLNKYSSEFNAA